MARIKYDSVAGFERRFEPEGDAAAFNAGDFTEVNASLLSEARMDQLLVVDTAEPAV
jgi:hypothetical protein